jgi:hypothetical protein
VEEEEGVEGNMWGQAPPAVHRAKPGRFVWDGQSLRQAQISPERSRRGGVFDLLITRAHTVERQRQPKPPVPNLFPLPPHRAPHKHSPALHTRRLAPRRDQPARWTHSLRCVSRHHRFQPQHPGNQHDREHHRQHRDANPDSTHHSALFRTLIFRAPAYIPL